MMFHVFYTRQAYVRTFMKDTFYNADLQNHQSQHLANKFHHTGPTDPRFMYDRIVYPCIAALPINRSVNPNESVPVTQGTGGK